MVMPLSWTIKLEDYPSLYVSLCGKKSSNGAAFTGNRICKRQELQLNKYPFFWARSI